MFSQQATTMTAERQHFCSTYIYLATKTVGWRTIVEWEDKQCRFHKEPKPEIATSKDFFVLFRQAMHGLYWQTDGVAACVGFTCRDNCFYVNFSVLGFCMMRQGFVAAFDERNGYGPHHYTVYICMQCAFVYSVGVLVLSFIRRMPYIFCIVFTGLCCQDFYCGHYMNGWSLWMR